MLWLIPAKVGPPKVASKNGGFERVAGLPGVLLAVERPSIFTAEECVRPLA